MTVVQKVCCCPKRAVQLANASIQLAYFSSLATLHGRHQGHLGRLGGRELTLVESLRRHILPLISSVSYMPSEACKQGILELEGTIPCQDTGSCRGLCTRGLAQTAQ
jgi:hypothetical protein